MMNNMMSMSPDLEEAYRLYEEEQKRRAEEQAALELQKRIERYLKMLRRGQNPGMAAGGPVNPSGPIGMAGPDLEAEARRREELARRARSLMPGLRL